MCSYFLQGNMENYQGDLADIIRASGGGGGGSGGIGISTATSSGELPAVSVTDSWLFQSDYPPVDPPEDFGHPFSNFRDPLLHELDIPGPGFFSSPGGPTDMVMKPHIEDQKILGEDMKIRPCNIFSRMLQISSNPNLQVSPCDSPLLGSSPRGITSPSLVSNDMISANNNSKGCLLENSTMQISSPRNTGIKRRKSQAKKVVCIPAPAPANSRPTGEIVPSDLWAWRKYGQKPIKGSPYPRGYYRCSSSKGCSARKQVERSRTDPNMLVITYTSEHNHPWPTQRNALAGSTRTQPSKNTNSSSSSSKNSSLKGASLLKEEQKESSTNISNVDNNVSSSIVTGNSTSVKEEMEELLDNKEMEMDDISDQFSEGFPQSYRPALPDSNHSEDFFADLGEIEADPLNLLFTQGFSGDEERENKGLDPFSFYDWTGNNNSNSHSNNNNNNTSFGEAKRGS